MTSKAYKVDGNDPAHLEAMETVSDLSSYPKCCARRFIGMDPAANQGLPGLVLPSIPHAPGVGQTAQIARMSCHLVMADAARRM